MRKKIHHKTHESICPVTRLFSRRNFIKNCALVTGGIAAYPLSGGIEAFAGKNETLPEKIVKPSRVAIVKDMDHGLVGESWSNPFNSFPEGEPPMKLWSPSWTKESEIKIEEMVRKAIHMAGDWPVEKGDVVAIKANLVGSPLLLAQMKRYTDPELQSAVTDARVVRAVARMARESGAKEIYIVCNPMMANGYINLRQWGYAGVAREVNAELVGLSDIPYKDYKAPLGLALKSYALPTLMVEKVNKVISVAALKTHGYTGVTLCLKNVGIGMPTGRVYGGPRLGLPHEKLAEVITDVCAIVGIDYALIDGIWGMEGFGPIDGDPVPMDLVIAGPDPVAVDAVGTEIMGFPAEMIGTTRMAQAYGMGTFKGTDVKTSGESLEKMVKQFNPVPKEFRFPASCGDVYGWEGL